MDVLHCSFCGGAVRLASARCPVDGARLAATPRDPMIGRVVGGERPYRIHAVERDDGLGRVYRARSPEREVTVHILYGDLAVEPQAHEAFRSATAGALDAGTTSAGLPFAVRPVYLS